MAEGGKIATVKKNGTALPIVDKTVDISVPTKTSDLDDDLVYNLGEIEIDVDTDMFSITQEQHDAIADMIRRAGLSKCYISYIEGGESYALPILDYVSYMGMSFVVFGEYEPSINSMRMIGISTTMNIGGFMRFRLLNRDDVQTEISSYEGVVHTVNNEGIYGEKTFYHKATFTNGAEISRPNSGAILKLSSSAGDTNFILERTGGSQCVLESGATVGLFGTKTNHPLQVRTNYINRMTIGTDGSVVLATDVAQNSNNNQVATTKWVNAKGYAQSSDIPTKTSDLTNDSGYITTAPVTSVNGRTGAVTGLAEASDLSNYLNKTTGGVITGGIFFGNDVRVNPSDSIPAFSYPMYFSSTVNGVYGSWEIRKTTNDLNFTTGTSGSQKSIKFLNDGSIQAKTQDSTNNSDKVATTAFVKSVLPTALTTTEIDTICV